MTVEQRFAKLRGSRTIGVRFRPGMARPFRRVPPAELTEKTASLEDLWGPRARALESRVECEFSGRMLASALIAPPAPDPVKLAIEAVVKAHGDVDLDWAASQAGMSPRQSAAAVSEESGLGPKNLRRILVSATPANSPARAERVGRPRRRCRLFRPGPPDSRFLAIHRPPAGVRFFQYRSRLISAQSCHEEYRRFTC